MSDSIGIVIPAYQPNVETVVSYIKDIKREIRPEQIIVEYDQPEEEGKERLSAVAEVNTVEERRGKGAAIMSGFDEMNADILAFSDADGSVPTESLNRVVEQIREDTADVSIGSRRHPDSEIVAHQTVTRRFLGDIFAGCAKWMLPTRCRDYQCGAKAVRATAWESIGHHCYEPGFAWDMELVSVAGALGYDIAEVPITWEDRPQSTVDPVSTPVELASALIDVRRRTTTIANSPRYVNVNQTSESTLTTVADGDD
ncbi:glycosyltransferase [Halorussus sp. MSC15.2]|uniref:glycosyltransferase n=1 Tax=Halorussus sp. MSC15.2 TaxID=2283638 RepID=UPI0013D6B6DC|nr:glycosyltransferase [Halorussus sp. MSC15.2]NEU55350.1 glycosyltransferase [Halorussus sp. MSC15.2]